MQTGTIGYNPITTYSPYTPLYQAPTQTTAQYCTPVNLLYSYPAQYYTQNIQPNADYTLTGIEQTPYGDNIYKYKLKNGQTVALLPKKNATTIIKTFVDAGSMNETDKNRGISHFNEHNVFNGSKHLEGGKFFTEVSKLGADTNASTDYAQTDFYIESPLVDEKSLKKIIEMHSDMLVNPLFPQDKVEKEKGPVTSEISMVNDNVATVAMNDLIKNLFQIKSNSNNLVAGSIETVNSITREDVYNHWKNHFTPDNMYTVLVGDFDPDYAIDLISKNFTSPYVQNADSLRTKEKLTPITKSIRTDYISPTDASTNVYCAFSGPVAGDTKGKIQLNALGLLLLGNNSARLTRSLNEIYALGTFDSQKVGLNDYDPKAIIYQFATQKGQDNIAIDKFYNAVQDVIKNPPTDDEMLIIKNSLLKGLSAGFENSSSTCDILGTSLLEGSFDYISEYKKEIENLTPADIVNAAKKYVDFSKVSIAVVHPYNETQKEIEENYQKSLKTTPLSFTGRNITTKDIKQEILSDNSALTINNTDSDTCYIDWRMTSKATVPDNPAASYVLEQLLNNGSIYNSKADLSYNASKKSVDFDVTSNGFQINGVANCLYTNLPDAIDTLKEAIYAPRITEEEFQRAVDIVKTHCQSMNKDASINLLSRLFGKYFPSPKKILKGLETLTLDDVKKHYNNLLYNSSCNFVVSAPFEKHPELKNMAEEKLPTPNMKFKPYAPKLMQSYIPNDKEVVLLDTEERNQAQIYKNYSFEISGNIEDEIKFELLNTILGGSPSSRLFQDLREKQKLAYRVSSRIQSFENSGILTLEILSTTDDKKQNDIKYDNLQKSLDGFKKHTDRLMSEYVTDEELESAKMMLKQDIAAQMELSSSATSLLSMNMTQPFGIRRIDEYVNAIDKITKEDIKDAANHVFKNKPVYSILASKDTVDNQMNYIQGLGKIIQI